MNKPLMIMVVERIYYIVVCDKCGRQMTLETKTKNVAEQKNKDLNGLCQFCERKNLGK